jgi:predicted DCC family thiol-disulfide oxidoreductase YuxK
MPALSAALHPLFQRPFLERTFGIDLRSLALFRASLGAVLLADLALRAANLATFYTDPGVMPRDWLVSVNGLWRISLHAANGEAWFAGLLLAIEALAALALLAGYRTRLANVVAFVLHGSLLNRNPLVLLGGDPLLVCLLFWGMFLPLGARWSVDAALARKPLEKTTHLSWASAGLLLQVLSVYFFSAVFKSGREWWPEGTAVWYALSIDGYITPIGEWLRGFSPVTHAMTYFVYFLELLGPPLALLPFLLAAALPAFAGRAASRLYGVADALRFAVMALLALMHIGFIFCLEIGPFAFVSLASLTVLAGGWIWDALERATQKPQPRALRIYYDRDCGFCHKSVLLMRTFLILPRAEIAPAQDTPRAKELLEANYSWVVIDPDERAWLKWPAFVILLRRSPLFFWLGALLSGEWAAKPGNAVYDFVGRHRDAFARVSSRLLPFHERSFEIGPAAAAWTGFFFVAVTVGNLWDHATLEHLGATGSALGLAAVALAAAALWWWGARRLPRGTTAQVFAGALVLVFLAWNLCTIRVLPGQLHGALTPAFRLLRVDQLWDMFAPFPSLEDGWFVIPGKLADGREIDLMHPERPAVSYDKPRRVAREWPDIRWHKYLERIWSAEYSSNRLYYGRFLCRSWNSAHPANQRLGTFAIIYMLETSVPEGQTPRVEQRALWQHDCG